jgi:hypothetical protein
MSTERQRELTRLRVQRCRELRKSGVPAKPKPAAGQYCVFTLRERDTGKVRYMGICLADESDPWLKYVGRASPLGRWLKRHGAPVVQMGPVTSRRKAEVCLAFDRQVRPGLLSDREGGHQPPRAVERTEPSGRTTTYLSVRKAASRNGVTAATILKWVEAGADRDGRKWRFANERVTPAPGRVTENDSDVT